MTRRSVRFVLVVVRTEQELDTQKLEIETEIWVKGALCGPLLDILFWPFQNNHMQSAMLNFAVTRNHRNDSSHKDTQPNIVRLKLEKL